MNRRWLIPFAAWMVPLVCVAEGALPRDVTKFVTRRDVCDHFRGEYPYDEERRRFLERNLRKYCIGTDKQLADLKAKYHANAKVVAKLNEYEATIEPQGER